MKKFIELIRKHSVHTFADFEIVSENTISYIVYYSDGGSKEIFYNIESAIERLIGPDDYISIYKETLHFLRVKFRTKKVFEND